MFQRIIENAGTLVSVIIFASIFFAGIRWRIIYEKQKGYRRIVSFSAGIAIAYVFMNFLPELHATSALFLEYTDDLSIPFPQHQVYGASLLGFVLFYGIEYIANWAPKGRQKAQVEDTTEKIRFAATIASYSLYAGLICYLLVRSLESGYKNEIYYTVAMALHFLSLRYSLWNEYGELFGAAGKGYPGVVLSRRLDGCHISPAACNGSNYASWFCVRWDHNEHNDSRASPGERGALHVLLHGGGLLRRDPGINLIKRGGRVYAIAD